MTEVTTQVLNRIRERMTELRISQRELARLSCVSHTSLGRRLAGRTSFTIQELWDVCQILGLRVSDLIDDAETEAVA